ncbi:zinc finger protein 93-like isoform X3 [Scomber scombrus]|uniref:Zinc finger protein 93-like isoform X3 n=1 Tax=Scomber scombrus TaxID=13677 RepID=A0AAV1PG56_SCOSC
MPQLQKLSSEVLKDGNTHDPKPGEVCGLLRTQPLGDKTHEKESLMNQKQLEDASVMK